jgi:hypothetical protein
LSSWTIGCTPTPDCLFILKLLFYLSVFCFLTLLLFFFPLQCWGWNPEFIYGRQVLHHQAASPSSLLLLRMRNRNVWREAQVP